jgi:hypothetical protein
LCRALLSLCRIVISPVAVLPFAVVVPPVTIVLPRASSCHLSPRPAIRTVKITILMRCANVLTWELNRYGQQTTTRYLKIYATVGVKVA